LRIAAANVTTDLASVVAELRGNPLVRLTVDGAEESIVAAAFSVSYRALADGLRLAFRLLGLTPGPDFTPVAVAALLDVPVDEATRRLRGLAAANLVEAYAPGRYRFHDLVRSYAEDRARAEEDETIRTRAWERLFGCYLATADAAVSFLGKRILSLPRDDTPRRESPIAFADSADALAWLDIEMPNLLAALRRAAAWGPEPAVWYLTDSVIRFFHHHGRREEWLELAPALLRVAKGHAEAMIHQSLGGTYFREGRHKEGIHHTTEAARAGRACGWRECEASAVANLGSMLEWSGRLTEAVEQSSRAIELFRALGNSSGESRALNSLSCHYRQLGRLGEAERCLDAAITLCRNDKSTFWEAANFIDFGLVLLATGRLTEAEHTLLQARDSFRDIGSRFGETTALNSLSAVHAASGDYESAHRHAVLAVEYAGEDGDRAIEAIALTVLGRAAQGLGALPEAETRLRQAVEVTRQAGLRGQQAEACAALAQVLAASGRVSASHEYSRDALTLARDGGYRLLEAEALMATAAAESAAARPAEAERAAREALRIWRGTGHVTGATRAVRTLESLTAHAGH
jgi:tetratricopeptide (TPR) repeat protein